MTTPRIAPATSSRSTGARRALDALNALEAAHKRGEGGLGVTRLAEVLRIDKSQASRTFQVLAEYGLADRDPRTREYRLGWRLVQLAQSAGERHLVTASGPILDQLLRELDESVYVSVRSGFDAVTVARREANHSIQATVQQWTLHNTAVGRVLLGDMSESDIRRICEGQEIRSTKPEGVQSIEDLIAEVRAVREQGYSAVIDEFEVGLFAAAAPIHDHHGAVVAALGVSGPTFRLLDRLDTVVKEVVASAQEIEASFRSRARMAHDAL